MNPETNTGLKRIHPLLKTGDEPFTENGKPLGYTLKDFWIWDLSDIVSNIARGRLAEFIVAKAVGIPMGTIRDGWDSFDLTTLDGVKIEVKSSAYVQGWYQKKLSAITFDVEAKRPWDAETGIQGPTPERKADVYVFALLTPQDKTEIDPLKINQWQFYVMSTKQLNVRKRSQHSITLASVQRESGDAVGYSKLETRINEVLSPANMAKWEAAGI